MSSHIERGLAAMMAGREGAGSGDGGHDGAGRQGAGHEAPGFGDADRVDIGFIGPGGADEAARLHEPVLLADVVRLLGRPGARYLDLTLGMGGHAQALLEAGGPGAELLGLDRDAEAIELARMRLASFGDRVHLVHCRASQAGQVLFDLGWKHVDGVLADLGPSSFQMDRDRRGFSFDSGRIDMRMDQGRGRSGLDLLERWTEAELADVLRRFGEEPLARRYASAIKAAVNAGSLGSARDLAAVIERAAGPARTAKARVHVATKVFMALRIAVNDELSELDRILERAPSWLAPGGRLAVISFHSLEDRKVKQAFRSLADPAAEVPPDLPVTADQLGQGEFRLVTRKAVRPSGQEEAANSRSRSAKLRVLERRPV